VWFKVPDKVQKDVKGCLRRWGLLGSCWVGVGLVLRGKRSGGIDDRSTGGGLDKRGVMNGMRMSEVWCQGGGVKDELNMGG